MKYNKKIIFSILLSILSLSVYAERSSFAYPESTEIESIENTQSMSIDLLINGNCRVKMQEVPTSGRLDVYSILGVKITSVGLSYCINEYPIELPKGLYIFRAGKTAQKIIVK